MKFKTELARDLKSNIFSEALGLAYKNLFSRDQDKSGNDLSKQ